MINLVTLKWKSTKYSSLEIEFKFYAAIFLSNHICGPLKKTDKKFHKTHTQHYNGEIHFPMLVQSKSNHRFQAAKVVKDLFILMPSIL